MQRSKRTGGFLKPYALCLNRFLNVKAVVATFNQLKAFSMIVQLHQLIVNSSKTEASLQNLYDRSGWGGLLSAHIIQTLNKTLSYSPGRRYHLGGGQKNRVHCAWLISGIKHYWSLELETKIRKVTQSRRRSLLKPSYCFVKSDYYCFHIYESMY